MHSTRLPAPSVSDLLDRALPLWARSLPSAAPLALIAALPGLREVLQLPSMQALQLEPDASALAFIEPLTRGETWAALAAGWLFALWLHTAQILLIDAIRRGEGARPLQALGTALLRLPAVLASGLALLILCVLLMLPLLAFTAWLGLQALPPLAVLGASLLASLVVAVPICWMVMVYLFAPYESALTGHWPPASFAASRRLVHGQWWRLSLFVSIPLTAYAVFAVAAAMVPYALGGASLITGAPPTHGWLGTALALGVASLGMPMLHACLIVALRESKPVRITAGAENPPN